MKIKLLNLLAPLFMPAVVCAGEDKFEKDRQAILSMAGEYEVTFFF